jgi:isoleucyl-tRNA synthetase
MKQLKKPIGRANFPEIEKKVLSFWKESKILEKSLEQNKDNELKPFYDGPITANGMPHHGHMITFAMKDLYPRYWSMQGYYVPRSLGWDCQGIPVEYEIEKKLGFSEKKDIEKYGIAEFNSLCRESVLEYRGKMIELEERMGRLTNEDETYATMDADYIESLWWSLKELHMKGLLYEGFKVVPYSTRAGTTLSNAEVSLGGYKTITDPAVTIEFPLKEDPDTRVLAWTTTPWTLPTNFALAVGKDIEYVVVTTNDDSKKYILAQELLEDVFGEGNFTIVKSLTSRDLIGKEYLPLFDFFEGREHCFTIVEGFHVTTENGTGVVHLAPYGAEDNEIFQQIGIESIDVLDSQGDFTDDIPTYNGINYRDANPLIIKDLEEKDRLFKVEDYDHEMPMCWRTNTPLIYKPIVSWYIAVSKMRNELVENNQKINWIPSHAKNGRFGNWLADIKDWGISRLRYWGTPLPIWKSESGKNIIIGSFEELKQYAGDDIDLSDPHRPYVDDITFEYEGEEYKRIPDVIDVWYDSGAMPFARFHYPFENKDKFNQRFPAEYIAEGVDQTRGWFYTLHALGTTLFDSPAFNNVIMSGFVLDDKGVKLSKSKKNYSSPNELLDSFGADTIRLNFFSTPITSGEDTTVSEKTLKTTTQEYMLPIWNLGVYILTYAELHSWSPDVSLLESNISPDQMTHILDTWMIHRVNSAVESTNEFLRTFQTQKALSEIRSLFEDISKWYIRSNRDRFAQGDTDVLTTSYYSIITLLKLIAPFTPYIAEELYQQLVITIFEDQPESIHLCSYPRSNSALLVDGKEYLDAMEYVRTLSSIGQKLRSEAGIKLRQPLSHCYITKPLNNSLKAVLAKELNVKEILREDTVPSSESVIRTEDGEIPMGLETQLTPELEQEGLLREVVRVVQNERKNNGFKFGELAELQVYSENGELLQFIDSNLSTISEQTFLSSIQIIQDPIGEQVNINTYKALFNLKH